MDTVIKWNESGKKRVIRCASGGGHLLSFKEDHVEFLTFLSASALPGAKVQS